MGGSMREIGCLVVLPALLLAAAAEAQSTCGTTSLGTYWWSASGQVTTTNNCPARPTGFRCYAAQNTAYAVEKTTPSCDPTAGSCSVNIHATATIPGVQGMINEMVSPRRRLGWNGTHAPARAAPKTSSAAWMLSEGKSTSTISTPGSRLGCRAHRPRRRIYPSKSVSAQEAVARSTRSSTCRPSASAWPWVARCRQPTPAASQAAQPPEPPERVAPTACGAVGTPGVGSMRAAGFPVRRNLAAAEPSCTTPRAGRAPRAFPAPRERSPGRAGLAIPGRTITPNGLWSTTRPRVSATSG